MLGAMMGAWSSTTWELKPGRSATQMVVQPTELGLGEERLHKGERGESKKGGKRKDQWLETMFLSLFSVTFHLLLLACPLE